MFGNNHGPSTYIVPDNSTLHCTYTLHAKKRRKRMSPLLFRGRILSSAAMDSDRLVVAARSSTPQSVRKALWTDGQVIQSLDDDDDPDDRGVMSDRL